MADKCERPPEGWYCSKDPGHDGPCPTRPTADALAATVTIPWATLSRLFRDLNFTHATMVIGRICDCSTAGVPCDIQERLTELAPLVERRAERRA